jgi:hypothetical protein
MVSLKKYSFAHVDTCLPDFLTDHHNREGEFLFSVSVNGKTRNCEVEEELYVLLNSFDLSGRFGDFDYDAAKNSIAELFPDILSTTYFDASLEYPSEEDLEDDDWYSVQAYFVLSEA